MKANELMVGDWVQIDEPDKYAGAKGTICSLIHHHSDDGAYFHVFVQDKGIVLREVFNEDLRPIPLAAEILEKNGFHKQKWSDLVTEYSYVTDLDEIPQTVIQYSIYSEEIEGVKSLCKIWTKSQFGNGQNDCHICGLYYVHELQRALRLCGIDKEIVL